MRFWFYWASFLRLCCDIAGLILAGMHLADLVRLEEQVSGLSPRLIGFTSVSLATWAISCINGLFLMVYDTQYSFSIFGSLLVQVAISMGCMALTIIVTLYSFLVLGYPVGFTTLTLFTPVVLQVISGGFSLIIPIILLCQLFALSRRSGQRITTYWSINAGDLSMNAQMQPGSRLSWIGSPRQPGSNSVQHARIVTTAPIMFRNFLINTLSRRVSPVETRLYALSRNAFALAAVILIIVRIAFLLSQLQNEDFLTRTLVRSCDVNMYFIYVIVQYEGDKDTVAPLDDAKLIFQVRIFESKSEVTGAANSTNSAPCTLVGVYRRQWKSSDGENWYRLYQCGSALSHMSSIEYIVVPRANETGWPSTLTVDYRPSLWFATTQVLPNLELDQQGISMVPYLTPALPVYPGVYVQMSLTLATRRFIVSSGIKDAITGSNPGYLDVDFYPWSQMDRPVHTDPSSLCYAYGNGSQTVAACGSVQFPPTGLIRHPTVTQRQLNEAPRSPCCTVIEDYRKSSMFDVLGSIGGLLALLQGVHVFLFGRPLFWGMFGAKLLTPFGLVGQFANRSFRQRLQTHYYSSGAESSATAHESENASSSTFLISQFLLDYVLDLGPAAAAPTATERDNAKPSHVDAGPESILQTSEHNRLLVSESVHRPLSAEGHSDPEPSSSTGDQRA